MIAEWIARAAARQGSAPYLEDAAGTGTLTYAGLRRSTRAWADCLDRAGVPPGARVAVRLPDPLGYATALVSILGAGRVVIPLDPGAPAADLSRVLAAARPQAAVSDSGDGLPPGLPVLQPPDRRIIWAERTWPEPGRRACGHPSRRVPWSGGIFLCTSGTTGAPKGILLREDQLCHVAASVAGHHRLFPADRGYCCLPLFHVNAEVVGLLATLAAGACLVLDRKFSRRGFWELIEQRRITWINAVPAIIAVLAMDPPAVPAAGRVRFVRSASAPLPPSVLRRFEEAYGIPVIETYGMTEAASMIAANPLDGPRKAGSVGRRGHAGPDSPASRRAVRAARPWRWAGCRSGAGASSPNTRRTAPRCHRPRRLARHRRPGPPRPGRLPVPGRPVRRRDQPGRREDLPQGNRGRPARPARRPVRRGGAAHDDVLGSARSLRRPGRSVARRAGGRVACGVRGGLAPP